MRAVSLLGFVLAVLLSWTSAVADDADWQLVFEDNFERAELGDDYFLASRNHTAEIRDGRLFLDGGGGTLLLIDRPFKPDVKLVFEAEANPDMPPCDLSTTMAANKFKGYWHLLGFGAGNNRFNHIVGGGVHARDNKPEHLVKTGHVYQMTSLKEGKRLALFADEHLIIEAEVDDPIGGPGFDHIGFITWNGMYIDNVKVYERKTPALGGPIIITELPTLGFEWKDRKLSYTGERELSDEVSRAIELYNQHEYRKAADLLFELKSDVEAAVVLGYVIGDPGYERRVDDQSRLAKFVTQIAYSQPHNHAFQKYSVLTKWFSGVTVTSRDRVACTRLIEAGVDNNPYYYTAQLFQARYHLASAQEGADRRRMNEAFDVFKELKTQWPEHQGLRELTGESLPWGEELIRDESEGPEWARYLQESMARQQAILNWWAEVRQASDGQLGGGWGDDVELLRSWVPAVCMTTATERAVAGIERLADGVWTNVCIDGYDKGTSDVEHSAEPSADAFPTMMLLRYGDPLWVERNLRSAKTILEKFMARNERGFLQFRARDFGMGGVAEGLQGYGDSGYHARAMKHFIWLGWFGIDEAKDVFAEWCETWRDSTARKVDTKIAGFPPSTIWYPSGDISAPNGAPWYDKRMNSYGFPGLPMMVFDSFLTAYHFTGDHKFIDAVDSMMDLATKGPLPKGTSKLKPDDVLNQQAVSAHMASNDITSIYRWLTGQQVYDEYTLRSPSPTQRYQIDHDLEQYTKRFERIAQGLRNNWTRFTSEVLQTDRAALASAGDVMGAFTGSLTITRDARCPSIAVTYDTPSLDFAAVVLDRGSARLRMMFYNFDDKPMRVGIRPYELTAGVYVLKAGEPMPGEREPQKRYSWSDPVEVTHLRRATPIWIDVPSGKEWVVDLRLRKPIERPAVLPDLAIHSRDVTKADDGVTVTVHNIGNGASGTLDVVLEANVDGQWKALAKQSVTGMKGIANFDPVRQDVSFKVGADDLKGSYRVVLDPDDRVDESYELNNVAVMAD